LAHVALLFLVANVKAKQQAATPKRKSVIFLT